MPTPTLTELSRWQFAITIIFHMTFPAITVGLSLFLALTYGLHLRTGKVVYLQIFRFWKRIFAVGFALGVVAGTVITFEFGLNWGRFANATGPVLAPLMGMEVVTGFFVEAAFIGIMLYGDGRVRPRTMFVCVCLVALGTVLSTTWIMVANSWMQTPTGYTVVNGRFEPASWRAIVFNPSVVWRFPHMLVAVLIGAAWLITGIAAYYLVKGRARDFARRTLSMGLGALAVLVPIQINLGDYVGGQVVARYQLPKLEAWEGNWSSTNTGYNVFVIPDMAHERNLVTITVPKLGSYFGKDLSGHGATPGLLLTPKAERPNMWTTFWGFRAMFYSAVLMFVAAFTGVVLRLRRRLYTARWFHRLLLWMSPVGVVAILGGWITAEGGRQPWVVYGQLRTSDAASSLAPASVILSLIAFVTVYVVLFTVWLAYLVRTVRRGPELTDPLPGDTPGVSTLPVDALAGTGTASEPPPALAATGSSVVGG